jgi:hypothetical protein
MTDRTQFEAMLEALINEDQETAKEIFHNIVVAKSREIYEELLESDFSETVPGQEAPVEEAAEDDEEGADDTGADDEEGADDIGADDEEGADDFGGDEEGGEEGEGEIEDRVMDLEDALDELKAEFEQLMADEEGEPEHNDGMNDPDFGGDEFGAEPDMGGDEFGAEAELDEFGNGLMEYTNKVTPPKHGDNGVNTKSPLAGKNDMGGTTANIVKGGTSTSGGTKGGLLNPSTKEENFGNVNVPGGNKGATKLSPVKGGHGAEKKGAGENAQNKQSIIGSRK